MVGYEAKKSLRFAASSLMSWVGVLGIVANGVAVCNFVFSISNLPLSVNIGVLIAAYKQLVHAAFDWVFFLIGIKLSPPVKDIIFFYLMFGGSFMRSRMRERVYAGPPKDASLVRAFKIVCRPVVRRSDGRISKLGRVTDFYQESPFWVRRTMDIALWPRVAKRYFTRPRVFKNLSANSFPAFPVDHVARPEEIFFYDRRYVFGLQLFAVLLAAAFVLIVNGYSTIPG